IRSVPPACLPHQRSKGRSRLHSLRTRLRNKERNVTMTSKQERYDLVILGSGSTAFAAALHAAELGKTVAMTEERTVGGTCANRGCLPSKNLIEAARLVHDAA